MNREKRRGAGRPRKKSLTELGQVLAEEFGSDEPREIVADIFSQTGVEISESLVRKYLFDEKPTISGPHLLQIADARNLSLNYLLSKKGPKYIKDFPSETRNSGIKQSPDLAQKPEQDKKDYLIEYMSEQMGLFRDRIGEEAFMDFLSRQMYRCMRRGLSDTKEAPVNRKRA